MFDTHKIVFALRIIGPYKNGYFEDTYTPGIQVQTLPIGGSSDSLGGGFKYFLCSPLFGQMIPFD